MEAKNLKQFSEINESSRIEIKSVIDYANKDRATRWVNASKLGFFHQYKSRLVNNIYFDTYDYRSINENISGISNRIKCRIRWYGSFLELFNNPSLEFKYKSGKIGWKEIFELDNMRNNENWDKFNLKVLGSIPDSAKQLYSFFSFPVLINQYRREYYISLNKKIRITIDTNIKTYDQRIVSKPSNNMPVLLPDFSVLEFKFSPFDYEFASEILNHFPMRISRCSKYLICFKAITKII
ncbi:polyphosphate polymerase domain-containing protein [Alphaproteobacteria bacterium]|nr:polyphosphate polymerase domain-containing protein [Alphaproteobacteria bacterium]